MPGVRVLVVDDSAFMRKVISDLLGADPGIEVVATARDGLEAVEKVATLQPDVITLDVEMPRLDGFGTLRAVMQRWPTPVVMVSSRTEEGAEATIRCLALGAVDFVAKPSGTISLDMHRVGQQLVAKVKAAIGATPRYRAVLADLPPVRRASPMAAGDNRSQNLAEQVVVLGSSTGGPGALHQVIPRLPPDFPAAVLIVQHMPPGFTRSLAARLGDLSAIRVKEAEDGDCLEAGRALVAPGGVHLVLDEARRVRLSTEPPVHGLRPAVDVTLQSVVDRFGPRVIGVVLTGMGSDGARSMLALKEAGGATIAEDASSCVVYGMPKAVVDAGAADQVLPIHEIPAALVGLVRVARVRERSRVRDASPGF